MKQVLVLLVILLTCWAGAQREKRLSKDEVHTFIQSELEKYRSLYEKEREARIVAEEQTKIERLKLEKLKAELFRLSK